MAEAAPPAGQQPPSGTPANGKPTPKPKRPVHAKPKPKLPSELYYRVTLSYQGRQAISGTHAATVGTGPYRSTRHTGAVLKSRGGVKLTRGRGKTFTLATSSLVGRVTRYAEVNEDAAPHCTQFRHRISASRLGHSDASLSIRPINRTTMQFTIASGDGLRSFGGETTAQVTIEPWTCLFDELVRDGITRPFAWLGIPRPHILSPPGQQPVIYGAPASVTDSTTPSFRTLRPALVSAGIIELPQLMRGVEFGARKIVRTISHIKAADFAADHDGQPIERTASETWKFTFDLCESQRRCPV